MSENSFRWEPAVYLQVANLAIGCLVAFGVLHGAVADGVGLVVAAVVALVTAILTRPIVVSAFTGVAQTLITAAVLFGLPITDQQAGAVLALLPVLLGLVLRANVSPAAKAPSAS